MGYKSAVVGQVTLNFFFGQLLKKKNGPQVPACMTVGAGLLGALPFHAWTVATLAPNTRRTGFLVLFWCGAKSRRRGLLNFFFFLWSS